MNTQTEELFTTKELAAKLCRSYRYVAEMKARGFKMPGGTATISEARRFLQDNPKPCGVKKVGASTF